MKFSLHVAVLLVIALTLGMVSIAVAAMDTQSSVTDSGVSDRESQITPQAGYSTDITSFTFWIDGVKYVTKNPGFYIDIYAGHGKEVMFSVKGTYNGPKGTYAFLLFQDYQNTVIRQAKVLNPGVSASMPIYYWYTTPMTDTDKTFYMDIVCFGHAMDQHNVVVHTA
jgi:hypothetical protein